MTLSSLDTEREALKQGIREAASRVPPGFSDWNWNRTNDFLKACDNALKLAKLPKPPTAELTQALTNLRGFWQ